MKTGLRRLALLDAILSPEWEYRYFSFNSAWSAGQEMGSMRDGSGGEWFVWFSGREVAYKAFSRHDARLPEAAAILRGFPEAYKGFIAEPAFSMDHITCVGYLRGDQWINHGLESLRDLVSPLAAMAWSREEYFNWAEGYYEVAIDPATQQRAWTDPADIPSARAVNPDLDPAEFARDIAEIGWAV